MFPVWLKLIIYLNRHDWTLSVNPGGNVIKDGNSGCNLMKEKFQFQFKEVKFIYSALIYGNL